MDMYNVGPELKDQTRLQSDIKEGATTRVVENQGARIPSLAFFSLAIGSMFLSTAIGVRAKQENKWLANFVGQWAPCFMLIGIYNKIVKFESEVKRQQMH